MWRYIQHLHDGLTQLAMRSTTGDLFKLTVHEQDNERCVVLFLAYVRRSRPRVAVFAECVIVDEGDGEPVINLFDHVDKLKFCVAAAVGKAAFHPQRPGGVIGDVTSISIGRIVAQPLENSLCAWHFEESTADEFDLFSKDLGIPCGRKVKPVEDTCVQYSSERGGQVSRW